MTDATRSIVEDLNVWVATVAPEQFTHGVARKGIEVLRNETLSLPDRSILSKALESMTLGGWLKRPQGEGVRSTVYHIVKRPEVRQVVRMPDRRPESAVGVSESRRETLPRSESVKRFEAFLLSLYKLVQSGRHDVRRNGVRAVSIETVFDNTITLLNGTRVSRQDIQFELADAVAAGLFWNVDPDVICWRWTSESVLEAYRTDLAGLARALLSGARASRSMAAAARLDRAG